MLSKIKVYGRLARFLGERTFEAEISTPLHAFKFLLANFPDLERHMMEQSYCIKVGKDEINEVELLYPLGQQEIKIVPVVTGSGQGTSPLFFGTTATGLGGALTAAAGNLGIYLALSGTAQLLSPVPQPPGVSEDPQSQNFSFSGVQNTSRAGTAIPVIYGEIFAGSLVVSAGIDTVQIKGTA